MTLEPSTGDSLDISRLTRDQQILVYTIDYLTKWVKGGDHYLETNNEKIWIKELPLWAVIYYQIVKGTYKTYDYAPTSIQFFGRSSFTVNLSYEGIDDIEDLRELDILEKIRLSTSQHGFVTAYRITDLGFDYLKKIPEDVQNEVHKLFYCEHCKTHLDFFMNMGDEPEIKIDCPECDISDFELDFLESEDVSYVSKPYFLRIADKLVKK
ncbi:MAG: hypothetical protein ACTSQF_07795 [Candidatus Heimdallarchaeaceae archaeon]